MTAQDDLDHALKRLKTAVELLEAAQARRVEAEALRANLDEEYAIMQDDRGRLAVELDAATARNQALATANAEVTRRLRQAGETIRAVLGSFGPGGGDA